jgi:hypothetical protein
MTVNGTKKFHYSLDFKFSIMYKINYSQDNRNISKKIRINV